MEAVVALGVAGNTVQFLDFATKLCVTSIEIYRNATGASTTNGQAETLLKSFIDTIDEVSNDLGQYFQALSTASTQASNQNDIQVQLVITDCQAIAQDLLQRFEKLKRTGRPGKWKSFITGVKCVWNKNELEELHKRLKKNRDELEWRIMEGLNLLASRQADQFRDLQSAVVSELTTIIQSQIATLPQWPASIEQTLKQLRADVIANAVSATAASSSKQPEKSAIRTVERPTTASIPDPFANQYAAECATKLAEVEKERWKSLAFQVMDDREDQIAVAELKTFDWILRPPLSFQRPWSSFIEWLENGDSIYWISGKAGSGKSTMMKYLKSHPTVQGTLRTWAEDAPLLCASFFFWYNGNRLQKTQEGLLRSLLYQVLKNHRELIPIVLVETFEVASIDLMNYWTLPRLKHAFKRVVEQQEVPLRFCFLVDGLDEYAGNHAEIVQVFQDAAKHSHVKICVSSRPLLIFDRAFKTCPGLMLQNLTFDDIQVYVESRFRDDERFQELELEESGLAPDLALQVVVKASGVFLWVKLVVHSLLEGILNYDRGVDLERRLDELPDDLNDLYWHMLDRVKPVWYLEEGFRLLLMVQSAFTPLTLQRVAFAELILPAKDSDLSDMTIERQQALCRSMAGRIKSRCLGLLEIVDGTESNDHSPRVQFLHKSVADFINTPEMQSRMQNCLAKVDFLPPELAIMQGINVELDTLPTRLQQQQFGEMGELKREAWFDEVRPLQKEALRYAEIAGKKYPSSLDQIDKCTAGIDQVTTTLWDMVNFRSPEENSGQKHWSVAPRKPHGTSLTASEMGISESFDRRIRSAQLILESDFTWRPPEENRRNLKPESSLPELAEPTTTRRQNVLDDMKRAKKNYASELAKHDTSSDAEQPFINAYSNQLHSVKFTADSPEREEDAEDDAEWVSLSRLSNNAVEA